MTTWADGYIRAIAKLARDTPALQAAGVAPLTDYEAFKATMDSVTHKVRDRNEANRKYPHYITAGYAILPLTAKWSTNPLAVQVCGDLATAFQYMETPPIDLVDVFKRYTAVYIDLPEGVYNFEGEWCIRAITAFTHGISRERELIDSVYGPNSNVNKVCAIHVILTNPQKEPLIGLLDFWFLLTDAKDGQGAISGLFTPSEAENDPYHNHGLFAGKEKVFQDAVSRILKLAVNYYEMAEGPQFPMRHFSPDNLKRHFSRSEQERMYRDKPFSLFKVIRLEPSQKHHKPGISIPREGWCITERIEIAPFERNQWVGSLKKGDRRQEKRLVKSFPRRQHYKNEETAAAAKERRKAKKVALVKLDTAWEEHVL